MEDPVLADVDAHPPDPIYVDTPNEFLHWVKRV
jgi:hypothetical protein